MLVKGKRWTLEEDSYLLLHRTTWKISTIAKKTNRTESAVYNRAQTLGCWPTRDELITSSSASKFTGFTQQWLTKLARKKRLKARRVPGGKWWLFNVKDLEELKCTQ